MIFPRFYSFWFWIQRFFRFVLCSLILVGLLRPAIWISVSIGASVLYLRWFFCVGFSIFEFSFVQQTVGTLIYLRVTSFDFHHWEMVNFFLLLFIIFLIKWHHYLDARFRMNVFKWKNSSCKHFKRWQVAI